MKASLGASAPPSLSGGTKGVGGLDAGAASREHAWAAPALALEKQGLAQGLFDQTSPGVQSGGLISNSSSELHAILAKFEACRSLSEWRRIVGFAAAADLRLEVVGRVLVASAAGGLSHCGKCIAYLSGKSPTPGGPPQARAPELLPVHPRAASLAFCSLLSTSGSRADDLLGWCMLALHGLNYFAVAGWCAKPASDPPEFRLSDGQYGVIRHIVRSVTYMLEVPSQVERYSQVMEELGNMRVDYNGDIISKRRDLVASHVLPAWPEVGQAAVLDILDFIDGELREDMCDLARCLKSPAEQPEAGPTSRVHASDSEWYKIVKEGLRRGIMVEVPEGDILRDRMG